MSSSAFSAEETACLMIMKHHLSPKGVVEATKSSWDHWKVTQKIWNPKPVDIQSGICLAGFRVWRSVKKNSAQQIGYCTWPTRTGELQTWNRPTSGSKMTPNLSDLASNIYEQPWCLSLFQLTATRSRPVQAVIMLILYCLIVAYKKITILNKIQPESSFNYWPTTILTSF